jgi:hypothetical protein
MASDTPFRDLEAELPQFAKDPAVRAIDSGGSRIMLPITPANEGIYAIA